MKAKPEVVQKVSRYTTPWFDIIAKTIRGGAGIGSEPYYTVRSKDYVTILAFTCSGEAVLVRQYRPAVEDFTLELPSGHVEPDETASSAIIRELQEETGYVARNVELLGCLVPDTGRLENRLWCYFADGVAPGKRRHEEDIQVELCPKQKLLEFIGSGKLSHALDLAVIVLAISKNRL